MATVNERERALVGTGLQQIRKLLRLSQADVAAAMGISASLVSWWETGRQELRLDEARRLAQFFDIPFGLFLERLGYSVDGPGQSFAQWFHGRQNMPATSGVSRPSDGAMPDDPGRTGRLTRPLAGLVPVPA